MTPRPARAPLVRVYVEAGARRTFAAALDWPGWCRSGRSEQSALTVLAAYAPRYARVAAEAGLAFPVDVQDFDQRRGAELPFEVVERVTGNTTTDFGAPAVVVDHDARPLDEAEAFRHAALVAASWRVLDAVVADAPAELRQGPRGGGRDRDEIVAHVLEAEGAYLTSLGLGRRAAGSPDLAARREQVLDLLRTARAPQASSGAGGWPPRYAARRIAWHVLDHAWEIEDRSRLESFP